MSRIVKARYVEVIPNPEIEKAKEKPVPKPEPAAQSEPQKPELKELAPQQSPAPANQGNIAEDINPANFVDDLGQTLFGQLPTSAADVQITRALEESKAITRKAEMDALRITSAAEAEAEKIKKEAEEKGYDEGYQAGLEAGKADGAEAAKQDSAQIAKDSLGEVAYLIEALKMERMMTLREEQEEIVQIAFEVAKKIMRQQIKVEKEAIPRMVEEVVKENETPVKVILSEFNETLFTRIDRRMRERIRELLPGVQVLVVPNDGSAETFQVETENGMVDAAVEGQLERLAEATMDPKDYEPEEI